MCVNEKLVLQEDQEMVAQICEGNVSALESLYGLHVEKMLGFANHLLGKKSDAEDVIHDVFIEVWNKASTYDVERGSVIAWLMLRVRSRSLDRIRMFNKIHKYGYESNSLPFYDDNNSIKYDQSLQKSNLYGALKFLSAKQRHVIELSYFKGLSCSEISRHCNIPLGTVKTRLFAAINKLKLHLNKLEI